MSIILLSILTTTLYRFSGWCVAFPPQIHTVGGYWDWTPQTFICQPAQYQALTVEGAGGTLQEDGASLPGFHGLLSARSSDGRWPAVQWIQGHLLHPSPLACPQQISLDVLLQPHRAWLLPVLALLVCIGVLVTPW